MEGRKKFRWLEEPKKIRYRFGGELINVARNPLGTVPNSPLSYALGK